MIIKLERTHDIANVCERLVWEDFKFSYCPKRPSIEADTDDLPLICSILRNTKIDSLDYILLEEVKCNEWEEVI